MTELIEKYIDSDAIIDAGLKNKYDNAGFDEFISFIDEELIRHEHNSQQEADETEEEYVSRLLEFAEDYMKLLLAEQGKGHGLEWSRRYAYTMLREDDTSAAVWAYQDVRKSDPATAIEELRIFATTHNGDEHFVRQFALLADEDEEHYHTLIVARAAAYSRIYKEQMVLGNSALFSHKYAECLAGGILSLCKCYAEAKEYEKAITAGEPVAFAEVLAAEIAAFIIRRYSSYEARDEEMVERERQRLGKKFYMFKSEEI